MKLLRLKLNSDFRSLKAGFEIKFRDVSETENLGEFQPYCFAGLNGSGKSNVLEALSQIFFFLELCSNKFKPDSFRKYFNPKGSIISAYELEYLIGPKNVEKYLQEDLVHVTIIKKDAEEPKMSFVGFPQTKSTKLTLPLVADTSKDASGKEYLPDLIVGYSSGENQILGIPFIKTRIVHLDEYIQTHREQYSEFIEPSSSLVYVDSSMSQAVLLSILIFGNDNALKPLRDELGILGMRSFRMNLNYQKYNDEKSNEQYDLLSILSSIEKLKNCATSWYEFDTGSDEKTVYLDFYVDEVVKSAVKYQFKDALEFFRVFQMLYTLNYHFLTDDVKEEIYQTKGFYSIGETAQAGPDGRAFYFLDFHVKKEIEKDKPPIDLCLSDLSDGEHQFLHTMGVCLMSENKRTLLLLDEPETHFNPDWRSKFINVLDKSIKASGGNNLIKDILLTSHSPFIISDCLPNNVFVFKRENGEINVQNAKDLGFNTYGTSVELILQEIFGRDQSIGDLANKELDEIDFDSIKTAEDIVNIKKLISHLGDSIEKDFVLARLNQLLPPPEDSGFTGSTIPPGSDISGGGKFGVSITTGQQDKLEELGRDAETL